MATTRSRTGDRTPSDRRHVGLTLPRALKQQIGEAAEVLQWSVGDWVLAAAAQEGPRLHEALGQVQVRRRTTIDDATFVALYLTADERDELDDQAIECGLNRSAFVTAVTALNLGWDLDAVVDGLRRTTSAVTTSP